MKVNISKRTLILTALSLGFWATSAAAQVAVIANKSVPLTEIKKSELLDFYSGDIKKWSNDLPVVLFDLKPKSEAKDTFYNFLGKSPSRMKSIWLKKMLMGEGEPPQAVESEEEMIKRVATTNGAIGFVSKNKVSGEVKTLFVIDKAGSNGKQKE
jgi:ABC-type phosphate transport system substrate-binding protein